MSFSTYRRPTSTVQGPAYRAWRIVIAVVIVGAGWLCGWLVMSFVFGGHGSASPASTTSAASTGAATSTSAGRVDARVSDGVGVARGGKRIVIDDVIENGKDKHNSAGSYAPAGEYFVTLRATVTRLDDSREAGDYNMHNFVIVGSDGNEYKPGSFDPDYEWFSAGTIEKVGKSHDGAMIFYVPDGVHPVKVLAEFFPLDGFTLVANVK